MYIRCPDVKVVGQPCGTVSLEHCQIIVISLDKNLDLKMASSPDRISVSKRKMEDLLECVICLEVPSSHVSRTHHALPNLRQLKTLQIPLVDPSHVSRCTNARKGTSPVRSATRRTTIALCAANHSPTRG